MGVHIVELNLGGVGGGGVMEPLQESLGRGVPYKILTSDKNCLFHYPV